MGRVMGKLLLILANAEPGMGFLTDLYRDWLAIVSLVLTLLGLVYTALQARRAASAAAAAKNAAEQTRNESWRRFRVFTGRRAREWAHRGQTYIDRSEWELAALSLRALADEASYLATEDASWNQMATDLRETGEACASLAAQRGKKAYHAKWNTLLNTLLEKLHSYEQPI